MFQQVVVVVDSLSLCPTLCDSMNCSPPGSSVLGTSQARILEWVAISFSNLNRVAAGFYMLSVFWLWYKTLSFVGEKAGSWEHRLE